MLTEWVCFMSKHGVPEPTAIHQASIVASAIGPSQVLGVPLSSAVACDAAEVVEEDLSFDSGAEAADMAPAAQQFPVPLGLYAVSIQRTSNLRRLHLVENCP